MAGPKVKEEMAPTRRHGMTVGEIRQQLHTSVPRDATIGGRTDESGEAEVCSRQEKQAQKVPDVREQRRGVGVGNGERRNPWHGMVQVVHTGRGMDGWDTGWSAHEREENGHRRAGRPGRRHVPCEL